MKYSHSIPSYVISGYFMFKDGEHFSRDISDVNIRLHISTVVEQTEKFTGKKALFDNNKLFKLISDVYEKGFVLMSSASDKTLEELDTLFVDEEIGIITKKDQAVYLLKLDGLEYIINEVQKVLTPGHAPKWNSNLDSTNFDKNIENWNPTQEEINKIILSYEELIKSTIEDCGDMEMAGEQQAEMLKIKINTFENKQELVKDYLREVFYATPVAILLQDKHLKEIILMLITPFIN